MIRELHSSSESLRRSPLIELFTTASTVNQHKKTPGRASQTAKSLRPSMVQQPHLRPFTLVHIRVVAMTTSDLKYFRFISQSYTAGREGCHAYGQFSSNRTNCFQSCSDCVQCLLETPTQHGYQTLLFLIDRSGIANYWMM